LNVIRPDREEDSKGLRPNPQGFFDCALFGRRQASLMSRKLKIPVCRFPLFHFENVNDQNIIVKREERPDFPANPEGVYRMVRMRSLDLFYEPVRFLPYCVDLPDNFPGGFRGKLTQVAVCPPGIADPVRGHLTPYFSMISFSEMRCFCRTSWRDSSSP